MQDANAPTLLSVDDVKVHFPIRVGGTVVPKYKPLRAVDGVSFALKQGETLGIVGESGCGKSTLARAHPPRYATLHYRGILLQEGGPVQRRESNRCGRGGCAL